MLAVQSEGETMQFRVANAQLVFDVRQGCAEFGRNRQYPFFSDCSKGENATMLSLAA